MLRQALQESLLPSLQFTMIPKVTEKYLSVCRKKLTAFHHLKNKISLNTKFKNVLIKPRPLSLGFSYFYIQLLIYSPSGVTSMPIPGISPVCDTYIELPTLWNAIYASEASSIQLIAVSCETKYAVPEQSPVFTV